MSDQFVLHEQLKADSILIRDLRLSQLRLNNQKTLPWLVLVPRRSGVREIHHLSDADQILLMKEVTQASRALEQLYAPDKINIGILGNIVPQFHVHVIARFKNDPAWPGPVWGKLSPDPYTQDAIETMKIEVASGKFWTKN